jgi:hypothetical protein
MALGDSLGAFGLRAVECGLIAAAAQLARAAWLLPNFNRLCEGNHFPAPKKPA